MSDSIEVEIVLNDTSFKKTLAGAENQGRKSGKKSGDGFEEEFSKGVGKIKKALGAAVAFLGVNALAGAVKSVVRAASEQEVAINDLNQSLLRTGKFSLAASQDLQNFASEIQRNTTFSDDAILSNSALIQSLGKLSVEGLKQATTAATNLSAALGIDLGTASTLVGKAAAGNVTAFSKLGIKIQTGATAAETFANAMAKLASFQGAAEGKTNTFAGSMAQLSNSFSEVEESLGGLITKSPSLISAFKFVAAQFEKAASSVGALGGKGDLLLPILRKLTDMAAGFVVLIVGPLEVVIRLLGSFVDIFLTGFQAIFTVIAKVNQGLFKFLGIFTDVFKQAENASKSFADKQVETLSNFADQSSKSAAEAFKFAGTKSGLDFLFGLRGAIDNAGLIVGDGALSGGGGGEVAADQSTVLAEFLNNNARFIVDNKALFTEYLQSTMTLATSQLSLIGDFALSADQKLAENLEKAKARINDFKDATASALKEFATQSVASFAQVGATLVNGGGLFDNFGASVLGLFGDLMIKIGVAAVLTSKTALSIAAALSNPFTAPVGIAAGLALIVAGGALKALAGNMKGSGAGGISGSSGGGSQGSSGGGSFAAANESFQPDKVETGPQVQVVVQGNILDRRQTGLELAEVISEAFGGRAVVFGV